MSVHADAKIHGNYGLKCVINDTNDLFVRDDTPNAETRYRFRFYVDINSITMADDDTLTLCTALKSDWNYACFVELCKISGKYYIKGGDRGDNHWYRTTEYEISDDIHYIELDWKAATGIGANNGYIKLWIDGILQENKSGLDSDTETVDKVIFGTTGIAATTSGIVYFDDFSSNNDGSEIGTSLIEILRPNAIGDITECYPIPGGGEANYEDVNEEVADDDSTFVCNAD
jgi:hypothetical protein